MKSTLLLNSSFEPLHVIPWQRAITMLTMGKVEVLETYDRQIRSVSLIFRMPAVVRLVRYVGLRPRTVSFSRQGVHVRDGYRCQYCGKDVSHGEATIDHVTPKRLGGETRWSNVVTSCSACNRKKGGHRPEEVHMKPMKEPRAPLWLPIFTLSQSKQKPDIWNPYLFHH